MVLFEMARHGSFTLAKLTSKRAAGRWDSLRRLTVPFMRRRKSYHFWGGRGACSSSLGPLSSSSFYGCCYCCFGFHLLLLLHFELTSFCGHQMMIHGWFWFGVVWSHFILGRSTVVLRVP